MALQTLAELFTEQIRDLYHAEQQLVSALQELMEGARSQELKEALHGHLIQTREHVGRLKQVVFLGDINPEGRHSQAIAGLIAEAKEVLRADAAPQVRDAALIAAAQRIEHYEIASYGTAAAFARQLGLQDESELLEATLEEEIETDEELTEIAESFINEDAVSPQPAL